MDTTTIHFDLNTHQVIGPTGALPVATTDYQAARFLMLLEGQCLDDNITAVAQRFGLSRQRYYQLLDAYMAEGLGALKPQKTGPKSNYGNSWTIKSPVSCGGCVCSSLNTCAWTPGTC